MNIIKNTNGNEYEILQQKGEYTLLKSVKNSCQPYIVAWCLKEYDDGYCWAQGHYFKELDNAVQYFDNTTNM